MTNNEPLLYAVELDAPIIVRAQNRVLRAKKRLRTWRAVGEFFGLKHHRYAYDLGMYGIVPKNAEIRRKLKLPRVMPSERKQKGKRKLPLWGIAAGDVDIEKRIGVK